MEKGDRVSWVHVSKRGSTINLQGRTGVVVAVAGNEARVLQDGKARTALIKQSDCRVLSMSPGEKTQLTALVEAIFENNRAKQGAA